MKMNHSKILYNSRSWEFRAKDISSCRLMRRSSWCPDIQPAVTMHKRPILAISSFSSHPLHSERGRRPRIHKGSENSFLNNSACSSLKMATKSVAKAAMKRDWKDKARDRVGAVSLSADTPSWYNSLQIMLPFFFILHSLRPCDERSKTFRVPPQDFALWAKSLRRQQKIVFFSIHKNKYA